MKKFAIYFLIIAVLLYSSVMKPSLVSGFQFDKNYLIDDYVFTNYNSMSLNEIENFLKENGSILAKYKQNGIPAAQIIFDASQKYKINPEVILVTLQKEEGLITLTYYNSYSINFAMGFHRPSDFKSQVYGGTELLRNGYDFLAAKYGWKVGVPHKTEDNPAYVKNVVIPKNKATASLYLYTPYIGGYYTSNGTYIGGNYNFVKIYNRWFGDPTKYARILLTPQKSVFYVPYGKSLKFPLTIKNVGNMVLNQKSYYITLQDENTGNVIKQIAFSDSIAPGNEQKVYIDYEKVSATTKLKLFVAKKGGNPIGNSVEVMLIPVKFTVSYKIFSGKLLLKISAAQNVPCAYLFVSFIDGYTGEEIEKTEIINKGLLGNLIEKTLSIPEGYQNVVIKIAFAGTDSKCSELVQPIPFFEEPVNSNDRKFNLEIDTVPQGASVFIDEKLMGKSPLKLTLKGNAYTLTVKNSEKTIKKEINLFCDTKVNFILNKREVSMPVIKIVDLPEITNKNIVNISGQVQCKLQISSFFVNGKVVKLSPQGSFSCPIELKEGENTIQITALDVYGNSESLYPMVILDTSPPKIITNDIPGITSNMFFQLKVDVEDGFVLFINNEQCKFLKCTKYLKLKKGENEIKISAKDRAGNIAEKDVKIIYLPPNPTVLKLFIGKSFLYVNGVKKEIDTPPIITDDRTMLPVRHIIEALNGKIFYYAESRTVEIRINGGDIILAIGKNKAIVNGEEEYIDPNNKNIKPFIRDGRTYLPLRFIMESIGSTVEWIPEERAVVIIYPELT